MRGEGDILDAEGFQIDRHFACRLDSIEVERNLFAFGDGGDFLDRKEDAGFIIGPEEGNNGRVGGDGCFQLGRVEYPFFAHREPGDLVAPGGEIFAELDGGTVLHRRGDDVALVGVDGESREDGGIGCLGAAAVEDDFRRLRADEGGDLFAGGFQRGGGTASESIDAGGVAKLVSQPRKHGVAHLGINRSGGVVVEVEEFGHGGSSEYYGFFKRLRPLWQCADELMTEKGEKGV